MARTRADLQTFLSDYVGNGAKVYFQPPPSVKMSYPAVLCTINKDWKIPANNIKYVKYGSYTVTVVDRDIDSAISDKIDKLPMCSFDRFFTADNLNHFVYTLYY